VHFKPGGAAFPLPAGELHNQIISLNELWHGRAAELRDCLLKPCFGNSLPSVGAVSPDDHAAAQTTCSG